MGVTGKLMVCSLAFISGVPIIRAFRSTDGGTGRFIFRFARWEDTYKTVGYGVNANGWCTWGELIFCLRIHARCQA